MSEGQLEEWEAGALYDYLPSSLPFEPIWPLFSPWNNILIRFPSPTLIFKKGREKLETHTVKRELHPPMLARTLYSLLED
jgi:hypothetical protein